MNRREWLATAGAAALGSVLLPARAAAPANYPNRPIRLIVPFIAGSTPDSTARTLSAELGQKLGQPLVVENMPGAGGIIGANALRRAAPDGYTLGILANTHVINVHMYRKMPYDPARDFTPITALSGGPTALVVPASSPYKTAADLVAAMKKAPGKFNYGSGGKGSIAHLAVETMLHQTGCDAVHIPYKGAPEIITAMLTGQTQFGMPVLGTATQYVRNQQVRVLAVTAAARSPFFPDVPTMAEALPPGFVIDNWSGLFAPANFPSELTQKLHAAVAALQNAGVFDAQLKANAGELRRSATPAQFGTVVAADNSRYGELMKSIGMVGDLG
ncbi:tripartite tricarboxylate transporter substrate binding protein [Cupriavidus oxalaticus]|jgi:tripartite-type tricarboxylate transporter receptor subunit TctC|uniref:ABC transporter substrate-binding protein n=1 Tax=Cupriavidus oxalaticus TaxID=96344 RepID=A0A375FU27_9BURK|nr:tripartite tricarboxylate transporter substrate binding protein [Cupriavidus oxalaticus]QRQ83800.1 tripartite tricarboxylate transporter substrate binding protein [Cupriavidus oxalaticus]QRQ92111.1 tripartite tricarboxylate transporter substrate binding protein [Cupriavidus oxalaticus]WQD86710.1 tripartite tricarboxylate transporter substrate binding protein [Cupriavidus oxalaticus]SPC09997.1 ABC transporter substrate-binding protein [Cupriavidus oxalaticus]SPC19279.1 ABC transporter substr